MKKINPYSWLIIALAVVLIGFLICFVFWPYPDVDLGPNMVTAFLGVFLSGALTLVLLKGQSKSDEDKDKGIKMYENKLKAFAEFNKFLWEKDELDDEKLRQSCMQNLIFYLENDQIQKLIEHAKNIKSSDKKGVRDNAKAEILKLLKESLNEKDIIDSKTIKNLYAILTPEIGIDNTLNTNNIDTPLTNNNEEIYSDDKNVDKNVNQVEPISEMNIDVIKSDFGLNENVTFWHFNALEPDKQMERLKQPNPILSLIEYGESWRTERLQEVQPGDIIFLFYRGGPGYVGMYRAKGTQVFKNLDVTDEKSDVEVIVDGDTKDTIKHNDKTLLDNDIYAAIADGGDYVANIIVEPLATKEEWGNPCGSVIRQTIARMSGDRVETLLKYFSK